MYPARSPRPPARRPRPRRCRRPLLLLPLLAAAPALLILFAAAAEATLHPVDYLALQSIRLTLNNLPGSRFFASWDLTADPCGFAGVSCSLDGIPPSLLQLRELSHNALAGGIPGPVRASLVHLDLRGNRLSGRVPPLPVTLVYLYLAGNRLSGRVGPVLRRLNRLAFLDLGQNWFFGEVPGEVFAFRIGYLQLRKNAFSGVLHPAGLVSSGATVDLSHNALSGRVPAELATAGAVYLNGNRFAGEVPREVAAAAEAGRMRELFLQDNFLTGIPVGGRGRRRPQAQCGGRRG